MFSNRAVAVICWREARLIAWKPVLLLITPARADWSSGHELVCRVWPCSSSAIVVLPECRLHNSKG